MNMYFCGFQGAGKTTIGRCVAEKLKKPFFDVDDLILERAKSHETIREFHLRVQEAEFRRMEAEIVVELTKKKNSVIALGGGSMTKKETHAALSKSGEIIYLCSSYTSIEEKIKAKIAAGVTPTYLNLDKPLESFTTIFIERNEVFLHYAHRIIHVENASIEQVVEMVLNGK
jgi:shikimate kinase